MLSKDSFSRTLKGAIYYGWMDIKKSYIIFSIILFGNAVLQAIISLMALQWEGSNSNNGGMLNIGFGIAIIFMFIAAIVMSGAKEIKEIFAFPANRKIFSLVKLLTFCSMTLGFLLITSAAYLFEHGIYSGIAAISDRFSYFNSVTFESFIAGFWVSFCYILFTTTLAHFLFLVFNRFKFPSIIAFALLAGILLATAVGRRWIYNALLFFIGEQSILLLSLKLLAGVVIAHFLGYLIQRKMEVNK